MSSITVKLSEGQKSEVEKVAEMKNYNSTSEYVREALRDKVERDLVLRPEVADELRRRLEQVENGDSELITHEKLKEEMK